MRVKPNPSKTVGNEKLKVYDPIRREFLPEDGRDVPATAYWLRRLQVGDVVVDDTKPEKNKAALTKVKPAASKSQGKTQNKKAAAKTAKSKAKPETVSGENTITTTTLKKEE